MVWVLNKTCPWAKVQLICFSCGFDHHVIFYILDDHFCRCRILCLKTSLSVSTKNYSLQFFPTCKFHVWPNASWMHCALLTKCRLQMKSERSWKWHLAYRGRYSNITSNGHNSVLLSLSHINVAQFIFVKMPNTPRQDLNILQYS